MGLPIRVLHVVVNMNRGGAETFIMNLYRNIDRSQVQFDFLTCKEGVFDQEIEKLGGKVHRIPYITDGGHFKYIKALETFFQEHDEYSIVHSHMDKMSGFVLRAANRANIPVRIAHSHNTSSEGNIAIRSYKWFAGQKILQHATHYFACSTKAADWLYGVENKNPVIVKNGIEVEKFKASEEVREQVRDELGISNEWVIGHVGRFYEQKNHSFLIDIVSEVIKSQPKTKLFLVGDGILKKAMEEKVKQLGLTQHVEFLGSRGDVHRLYQAFDLIIFPSLHEGLPVTLIEAQCAGLPCLISDVITKEVDLGAELVTYETINKTPKDWARLTLEHRSARKDTSSHVKHHGYDILDTALFLKNFYLQESPSSEDYIFNVQ